MFNGKVEGCWFGFVLKELITDKDSSINSIFCRPKVPSPIAPTIVLQPLCENTALARI